MRSGAINTSQTAGNARCGDQGPAIGSVCGSLSGSLLPAPSSQGRTPSIRRSTFSLPPIPAPRGSKASARQQQQQQQQHRRHPPRAASCSIPADCCDGHPAEARVPGAQLAVQPRGGGGDTLRHWCGLAVGAVHAVLRWATLGAAPPCPWPSCRSASSAALPVPHGRPRVFRPTSETSLHPCSAWLAARLATSPLVACPPPLPSLVTPPLQSWM